MDRISYLSATLITSSPPLDSLFERTFFPFNFSWNSSSIPHPARYALFLTESSLIAAFCSPIVAWSERNDRQHDFARGLWEYDLGEVFISSPQGASYQEFNLAPSGAWWSCLFSGYRTASSQPLTINSPNIWNESSAAGWRAAFEIPFTQIQLPFDRPEDLRVNVCGIQGSTPRHYLSAATIATTEPDFHHSASFLPLHVFPAPKNPSNSN